MSRDKSLPPKPSPPGEDDCCDSACELCVKDIYEQELKIWRNECNNILIEQAEKSSISPNTYTKCEIKGIEPHTHDTSIYTFDSNGYVEIKPGQHLILREFVAGSNMTRQYTPISVPTPGELTFKVLIKHYTHGPVTSHIATNWKVGDTVDWRGPHGLFLHQPNKYMKYLLLGAGTGIAPMMNISRLIVENDDDITSIKLLYACRTYEDIILRPELKQLAQHWNFTYRTYISQDNNAQEKKGYGENIACKRILLEDISNELTNVQSTRVLICGTRQFDLFMLSCCRELGVPLENVHKF